MLRLALQRQGAGGGTTLDGGAGGGTTLDAVETTVCTVLGALVTVFSTVEVSDCTGDPDPPPGLVGWELGVASVTDGVVGAAGEDPEIG